MTLQDIVTDLKNNIFDSAYSNIQFISESAMLILDCPDETIKNNSKLFQDLIDLITIGNATYNYSDSDILPIDDGIYDMLVNKIQRIDYNKFQSGFVPITINSINNDYTPKIDRMSREVIKPFSVMPEEDRLKLEDSFYPSILTQTKPFDPRANIEKPFMTTYTNTGYINKRVKNTAHNYPNLVGTLEKCKFVLTKQAKELGVADDANVTILERDFFAPLLTRGVINTSDSIQMIGTLKYDGVSIEADVNTEIISARTRGDTDYNMASDLTPIFEGYKFPNARKLDKPIGMKFEAIVLYDDLNRLNNLFGTSYINGRTAIIGLLGSSDARKFRDFITLIPLQADFGEDVVKPTRQIEIEFLNRYYANREYLRWVMFDDTYMNLMFLIKKYVEEAEYFRAWSRFMYDGVVLEFTDPKIVNQLGRKNSINQYAMAVKFNPLKRITTFTGYTYTVGQNGAITPMIHYTPIEFLGSIHTKSTGSSYDRFKELNLYIGDKIEVTYINDVMPYVTKPDLDYNIKNHMREPTPEELFPTHCPCCGTKLQESTQGKTMYCPNMQCGERTTQRLTNMLNKLGIKDFSQSAIETIGVKSFSELMCMAIEDFECLGPTNKIKFHSELQKLRTNPLPDYRIIGALGFTNVASKKWKIIFNKISILDLYDLFIHDSTNEAEEFIANIKGVGPITAQTICNEFWYFSDDIFYIMMNGMYINTCNSTSEIKYQIRFSGFRDSTLSEVLNRFPFIDCDSESGITKQTTILLVPYLGFTSSKTAKADKYNIRVVPVKDFLENPGLYIPELVEIEL